MLRVLAVCCRTSDGKIGTKPHSDKPNWHTKSHHPMAEVADEREPKERAFAQGSKWEEEVAGGATTVLQVPSQKGVRTV